jgi:uncharacterized protein (TIGR03067 family)
MKPSVLAVVATLVGAGLCLVGPRAAMSRSQGQPPARGAGAEEKEGSGKLEGSWELVECDYRHTIGYHPDRKVSPGYALLMYAFAAANPRKDAEMETMRWRFAEKRLTVETVSVQDKKEVSETLAEFDYVLRTRHKPAALDLTWRPPGFDDLCKNEKGQKVLGIFRCAEKLEVVLDFSGKQRPADFKPDKTRYRLVFRRMKQ